MKNAMIAYLKEINKGVDKDITNLVTRLYYNQGKDYVEDFSYFTNENYMSEELLNAIRNSQTLTTGMDKEMQQFIIEANI